MPLVRIVKNRSSEAALHGVSRSGNSYDCSVRIPAALDATVRWLALTMVGVGLFVILPSGAFGSDPVLTIPGLPGPTLANLAGIGVMLAAQIYRVIVLSMRNPAAQEFSDAVTEASGSEIPAGLP